MAGLGEESMNDMEIWVRGHRDLTRRYFLGLGAAGVATLGSAKLWAAGDLGQPALDEVIAKLEYLTRQDDFRIAGRGMKAAHGTNANIRQSRGL